MTVAAAITTFNRLEMLKRCIEAVRAQSVPPDEIIVVDDASSDGTATWLREQDDLVVIIQPGNFGCANSFSTVLRAAFERGHDWVWAMDDDVFAGSDSLALLLEAGDELTAKGVRVGGLKAYESNWHDGTPTRLPFALPSTLRLALKYRYMSKEVGCEMGKGAPVACDSWTFCSTLFPRAAMQAGGFPDPDFFYYGEDYDYAFKLKSLGFQSFVVPRCVVEHAGGGFGAPTDYSARASWRYYYMYRNQWALIRRHGHLVGWPKKLACEARILAAVGLRLVRETRRGNFPGVRLTLRGIFDGLRGRMGKQVAPTG